MEVIELKSSQIVEASELVKTEWGEDYAKRFLEEANYLLKTPYAVLLGAVEDQKVRGIVFVFKDVMDYNFWSLTWVVVDPEFRGGGIGKILVEKAEAHIEKDRVNYPTTNPIIQLTTTIPEFYDALGYHLTAYVNDHTLMIKSFRWQGKYDRTFGDDKVCTCGHSYYRHFDTYADMDPIGCKYCGCRTFEEVSDKKAENGLG